MCGDCGHPRLEHIVGPRGCTHHTSLRSVFVAWCTCDGWYVHSHEGQL